MVIPHCASTCMSESFRILVVLAGLLLAYSFQHTVASDIDRTVSTAAEFVKAIVDPAVTLITIERDICVSSSDWDMAVGSPPFIISRSLTIAGRGDGESLSILDLAYVPKKIWLAPNVTIVVRDMVFLRTRRSMLGQAPGMDLIAGIPGLGNKTADPSDPSTPTVRLLNAVIVIRACFPSRLVEGAVALKRPPTIPGRQMIDAEQPQPDCISDPSTEALLDVTMAAIKLGPPPLRRCWSQLGVMVDLAGIAAEVSEKGTAVDTYYMTHAVNVSYLCVRTMKEECFQTLGPLGCFMTMLSKEAVGQEAATCDSSVLAGLPEPPGQGAVRMAGPAMSEEPTEGQHTSHAAVIAGVASGVVGLLLVVAAVGLLYRWLVKRRREDTGKGATSSVMRQSLAAQELGPHRGTPLAEGSGESSALETGPLEAAEAAAPIRKLEGSCAGALGAAKETPDPYAHGKASSGTATDTAAGLSADLDGCRTSSCVAVGAAAEEAVAAATEPEVAAAAAAVGSGNHAFVRLLLGPTASGGILNANATDPDGEAAAPSDPFDRRRIVTPETPLNPGVELHALPHGVDQEVRLLPGQVLGRGAQGRVLAGVFRGQPVAVKLLGDEGDWASNAGAAAASGGSEGGAGCCAAQAAVGGFGDVELLKRFYSELEVLGRCQHPNVVRLLAACLTPPRLCLVMERMETSLERLMYSTPGVLLPLPLVLHISLQVALGLAYLHPTIIHRDLKPGNVLLDGVASATPEVKLADFGISRLRTTAVITKHPAAGTAAYLAPEAFDACNFGLTSKTDMYSWAVLTYEMLAGSPPWPGLNTVAIAYRVAVCQERPNLAAVPAPRRPPRLAEAICRCWDQDPGRRLAAAEVVKELVLLQQALGLAHLACAASLVPEAM